MIFSSIKKSNNDNNLYLFDSTPKSIDCVSESALLNTKSELRVLFILFQN